ncbi:MAG: HD domain-containing protein [Candidatus Pacebacteria bacterium]|nr:HD domain-containing protein [Candidatus Paceibacterota bacterium]
MKYYIRLIRHSVKVAFYSFLIGIHLKLQLKLMSSVVIAALFHDVGKFELDFKVLYKPSKLTEVEFEYIKTHSKRGADLLKKLHFPNSICEMVLQHHENIDGSGYPYGLERGGISVGAKIIRVADVYSSLTVDRVYRRRFSEKETIEIMLGEIMYYDFEVFSKFLLVKKKKFVNYVYGKEMTDKIY